MVSLSDKSHFHENILPSTAWMHLVPFSARLCLTKTLPDYLMDINVDSFLSVISCKPFINFSKSLPWEINDQREKSDPDYIPKMFAAPCFWLIWFVSSIPLLVSLLLTIMGHAIISLSIVNRANWFALLTMVCHKSCNLFVLVDVIVLNPTMNNMRVLSMPA